MKLILATKNEHKVEEFQRILAPLGWQVIPQDAVCPPDLDIEETGTTFAENARIKAREACRLTGLAAIADDSGLCVDALGGAPGVYSARYSSEGDDGNNQKLLRELADAVHAAGGYLMAALAPKTSDDQPGVLYEGHDYAAIGQETDKILLMTYEWGFTYGPPMAVAPLNAVERVVQYAVSRIEAGKLLLGFPNYAYDWTLPHEAGLTRAATLGNEAAAQLAFDTGSEIFFDEPAQTPWFSYTGMDGAVHEVWFEDVRSSLAKFALVRQYGLGGLGYWNFMRPFAANFSLLNAQFRLEGQTD